MAQPICSPLAIVFVALDLFDAHDADQVRIRQSIHFIRAPL
ncbi:MAG: hypothetical protein V4448_06385 [Pseudomonadota bacterium]